MRILYVEDNPEDADLTRRQLAKRAPQFELDTVTTLREALDHLVSPRAERYDLALVDLRLPDGNGMDLLRHIREHDLPLAIVIITGRGDEEAAVVALKAGANDYVAKREDYLDRLPIILKDALHRFKVQTARHARPLQVLYAEHNAADIDLTRRHLARYAPHIRLDVVHTAIEVLQRLPQSAEAKQTVKTYDLLLLDYKTPDMNGIEMLKEIRQQRRLDVPIVLITGRGSEEVAVQALKLGAANYVVKNPGYLFRLPSVLANAFHRVQLARDQAALEKSRQRYRNIFEGVHDAILVESPSGEILDVNARACEMFGYTREEFLTMTAYDLVPAEHFALIPDELEANLPSQPVETVNVRANGERFPVEITGQLQTIDDETALLVVVRDITERKRAEESLRASEARLQSIFRAAPVGIGLVSNRILLQTNDRLSEMLGYSSDELVSKSAKVIYPTEEEFERVGQVKYAQIREHGTGTVETRWRRKDGEVIDILLSSAPIDPLDISAGVMFAAMDITKRKRAEGTLRQYAERMRTLRAIDGAILAAWSPEEIAQAALHHIRQLVPCSIAAAATFNTEVQEATLFALHTDEELGLEVGTRLSLEGIATRIEMLQQGQVLMEEDISATSQSSPAIQILRDAGIRSCIVAPLISQGELIGTLALGSEDCNAFCTKHTDIIHEIADQVAVGLRQARLYTALEAERQRLEVLVEHVPEGILLLDSEWRIMLCNPAAQTYLAILADGAGPSADFVGDTLTHLADRPVTELLQSPSEGLWYELEIVGPPRRIFEMVAQSMAGEDETGDWLILLREVTVEREVQERIQRQERLAAVGQLAGGIAHDFNNLLTTIMLYAQMSLSKNDLPPNLRLSLETILGESRRAAQLIQQILDFSRRSPIETRPLDLKPFIKEAIRILERTIPESISLLLEIAPGDYVVKADPTRIQQVLMNLVVNARDAMPDGGILRIGLSRREVQPDEEPPVAEMTPGEWISLSVSDTGTGIPPDILPYIFEPFFTTKPPGEGAGLGLAQVYGIVIQHQGHVDVETEVGEGSTFHIYLPSYLSDEEVTPQPEIDEALPRGRGETILLVEDNERIREAGQNILESLGYRVLAAKNGQTALHIYQTTEETIDLVLTDIVMPEMGGQKLIQELKKTTPNLKTLAITGHLLAEDKKALKRDGIQEIIRKPLDMNVLAEAVRRALDKD